MSSADENMRSMTQSFMSSWDALSNREQILTYIVLFLLWGGIIVSIFLAFAGITSDPGSFFWGCLAGSVVLSYLAYIKKKMDIVSLLTPVYAVIIFLGLEIPVNLGLQIMFAGSLTILIIRLHTRFS
ncbi:MAG TPA: hypothetical protein VN372_06175 [Methanospirillum sp.]|nr:hypothetical protein [Methanospirillum sp.]